MRIISGRADTLFVRVMGRKPLQSGAEELVFPGRTVAIPPAQFVELPEQDARIALNRYGISGLMEVPADATDAELPAYVDQARRVRYSHLRQQLDNYRMQQGTRQAAGQEILMPTRALRAIFDEAKTLKGSLAAQPNPLLDEKLEPVAGEPKQSDDPMGDELRQFGITPKAAPLTPGVTIFDQGLF